MREVVVIQRRLTHYRVPFFEELRRVLEARSIRLRVLHGQPTDVECAKNDSGTLSWAEKIKTRYGFGGRLCWLKQFPAIEAADLVVLTPENKMLSNLPVQYGNADCRVALWGHGANLQGDKHSLRERFKRVVAKQTDWWFGYTGISVPLIMASGFPESRITVLNNSIDTSELSGQFAAVDHQKRAKMLMDLGLTGGRVGIYLGSLYEEKRIPFLLQAADAVRKRLPDFEFLIVGGGPQQDLVESYCRQRPWARYLGVCKGQAKADALALADVMLNPGAVGLAILDSFVCSVPMATTNCGSHGPEIAYLDNGRNGVMTSDSLEAYVAAVCDLLNDMDRLAAMSRQCVESGSRYTVENMARNFADGVEACLAAPFYRGRQ